MSAIERLETAIAWDYKNSQVPKKKTMAAKTGKRKLG
jgi:hypothetical protein